MEAGRQTLSRRQFLSRATASASASALALAAHEHLAAAAPRQDPVVKPAPPGDPRYRAMRLATAAPIAAMKEFYQGVLGQEVLHEADDEITFRIGATKLTYFTVGTEYDRPWYHIAFNIPENKFWQAREWQLERTPLKQRSPGSMTHPDHPDVANFWHWNAHSVFFWDPADNLLEHIARHDLPNAVPGPFTSDDLLCVSELGFMVEDAPAMARTLCDDLTLEPYRNGNDRLTPIGDEHGLLLIFDRGRPWRMSDGTRRPTDVYPTEAKIRGPKPLDYEFEGYPYSIRVE